MLSVGLLKLTYPHGRCLTHAARKAKPVPYVRSESSISQMSSGLGQDDEPIERDLHRMYVAPSRPGSAEPHALHVLSDIPHRVGHARAGTLRWDTWTLGTDHPRELYVYPIR